MKLAILLTITRVSLFGSVLSSPNRDLSVSLVDQIRRADALRLVQASEAPRRSSDDRLEMKAADLLRSIIRIVQSYTDEDFEELLKVIRAKIEKIDSPDKKVVDLKSGILKKLEEMQGTEGAVGAAKGALGDVLARLQDAKYGGRAIKLDSADKRASALNILSSLNDLDAYRFKAKRTDISLSDVVRGGLEALAALLAPGPRAASASSTTSASSPPPAAPPALGELVLLSLLSLPALSSARLQLVKETEVAQPHEWNERDA